QYLRLLREIQQTHGLALIFITHNLGIVARMCDTVAVMYGGRLIESGPVRRIFDQPAHPYTRALLDSIPRLTDTDARLTAIDGQSLRRYRRSVQAVFQDPFASLDPRMRVGDIIAEPLVTNEKLPKQEVRRRIDKLLDIVGLPSRSSSLFPHEFSGGQRQRIAIARSLALSPRIIVLDEPVSALDVSIRAQILNLLRDLQRELGLSYLFIAHDLAAVAHMSHTIAVMYLGKIVEIGDARVIAQNPQHPYTKALFSAALPSHPDEKRDEIILSGEVPSPVNPPAGCRFHPRCPSVMD